MWKYVIIFFITAVIAACSKSRPIGENEFVILSYNQTLCADPWPTGSTDSLTLQNLAGYLKSSGLYISSLDIRKIAAPDACTACNCKTGKALYVSTLNSDTLKARYGRLGFR